MREPMLDLCIYEKLFPAHMITIIGIAEDSYPFIPLLDMTLHCFKISETCRRFGNGNGIYDSNYEKAEMRLLKYLHNSRRDTNKSAPPISITISITALPSANARQFRRGGKTKEALWPPPLYQSSIKPNISNTGSAASKPIYPHNTLPTTPNVPP